MLNKPTVFVVGAGASVEAKLPSGAELLTQVQRILDLHFHMGALRKGDNVIVEALKEISRRELGHNEWDIKDPVAACRQIAAAMDEAISIDNFVEAHSHNEHIIKCGKLAIARALASAERNSKLFVKNHNLAPLRPANLKDTWYEPFWQLIHQGVSVQNVENIFENLSIISFNYDRCIHQRLFWGLQSYFGLQPEKSLDLLSTLRIYYPYGSLGDFTGHGSFGLEMTPDRLISASENIITFSESIRDPNIQPNLELAMQSSEQIIFLGFAFHPQNMRLLSAQHDHKKNVFATAYGIPQLNKKPIVDAIFDMFGRATPVEVDFSTCRDFFRNYWYHMSQ